MLQLWSYNQTKCVQPSIAELLFFWSVVFGFFRDCHASANHNHLCRHSTHKHVCTPNGKYVWVVFGTCCSILFHDVRCTSSPCTCDGCIFGGEWYTHVVRYCFMRCGAPVRRVPVTDVFLVANSIRREMSPLPELCPLCVLCMLDRDALRLSCYLHIDSRYTRLATSICLFVTTEVSRTCCCD